MRCERIDHKRVMQVCCEQAMQQCAKKHDVSELRVYETQLEAALHTGTVSSAGP